MKFWGYYAFHTVINSIKKMFRSTVILVFVITFVTMLLLGLIIGGVVSTFSDDSSESLAIEETSREDIVSSHQYIFTNYEGDCVYIARDITYDDFEETFMYHDESRMYLYDLELLEDKVLKKILSKDYDGKIEGLVDLSEAVWTGEEILAVPIVSSGDSIDKSTILLFVQAFAILIFITTVLLAVNSGGKSGANIFMMPDVNFLFTSPMKPQSVLLFRLSLSIATGIVGMLYLLFQIPNLMNLGMSIGEIMVVLFAIVLLLITNRIISTLVYTVSATHEWMKPKLPLLAKCLAVIILLINATVYMSLDKQFIKTVETIYCGKYVKYIPMIGWFDGMVMYGINDNISMCLLFMILFIIGLAFIMWGTWQFKADFYEDALEGAQAREEILQAAENKTTIVRKKERSKKIKRNVGMRGQGANVFFYKEMYNRKRMAKFGFFTNTMLTYIGFSVLYCLVIGKWIEYTDFSTFAIIFALFLFFRSFGNPIGQETGNHWLSLVPESAMAKVFYSVFAGTASCSMDIAPAMMIVMIILKVSPVLVVAWFVGLVTFDFANSSIGILLEAILPFEGLENIKASIAMMLRITAVTFLSIPLIVGMIIGKIYIGIIVATVLSMVFSIIAFIVYPLKMENGI